MIHTLSLEYPENLPDALHMSRAEFEQEARLAMAAKLFETGKLTSGQAARLVGMARVAFLRHRRRGQEGRRRLRQGLFVLGLHQAGHGRLGRTGPGTARRRAWCRRVSLTGGICSSVSRATARSC
jgi:predicted HTH domain antitoxin